MSFSASDSRILGPLFATDAMRAVFSDESLLRAMLRAEAALARALARFDLAPAGLAAAIEAIDIGVFDLDALGRETATAGVPVIPFLAIARKTLPHDLEPYFHLGATTQDIADTALMLQAAAAMPLLLDDLGAVLGGLDGLARKHRAALCVGRTYGQHAAPTTFGFKVAGWAANLADAAEPWPDLAPRVLVASLGGPVGNLAAFGARGPAVSDAYAAALKLNATPLAWHTRRARLCQLAAWLGGIAAALAKMAGDVVDLCSTEIAEVSEPHVHGRGGSSTMPHKRNPVSSTVILATTGAAKGHVAAMLDAAGHAAHERPAGAWHQEWLALPMLFGFLSGALREARALSEGLSVDAARMRENLDLTRGLVFADAAANRLAPVLGRVEAHAAVARAADAVRARKVTLRDALRADIQTAAAKHALDGAFDTTPAVEAASAWVERASAAVQATRARLASARKA